MAGMSGFVVSCISFILSIRLIGERGRTLPFHVYHKFHHYVFHSNHQFMKREGPSQPFHILLKFHQFMMGFEVWLSHRISKSGGPAPQVTHHVDDL